jgi:hypothetical protein
VEIRAALIEASEEFARAIAGRRVAALRPWLAPGFTHRSHGGEAVDVEGFLRGIEGIPGEIVAVRVENLEVDPTPTGALVTGTQYAAVRIDGTLHEERRGFVDWFVRIDGAWRIQAAVDLPLARTGGTA